MRSDIQTADIPIGSINCTIWVTEPNPTEVLFGVDALSKDHVSQSDLHNSTTSNSLTSQHCATFLIEFVRCLARHLYVQQVFQARSALTKATGEHHDVIQSCCFWRCCRRRPVRQQSVAAIVRTAHGLSQI